MKKILITGGAGFIGYHLARHLLKDPEVLLVLVDNLQRGRKDGDFADLLKNPKITFLELDLTLPAAYDKIGGGYDHVYHLAAVNGTKFFYEMPHEVLRINTLTLVYMLEWFRKNNARGKFCFTSSNEAYAGALTAFGILPVPTPERVPLVIDDAYNSRWSYAASKLVGELFVIHYADAYNFRALILRPHNFYGPRAGHEHVVPSFCEKIIRRADPFSIHGGDETRSFCYIDDAVRAMALLMDSQKTDTLPIETVHIGVMEEITMRSLAEKIFAIAGWRPTAFDEQATLQGSVKRRCPDTAKLQTLVGWKPFVSLEEGLARTLEWYSRHPRP